MSNVQNPEDLRPLLHGKIDELDAQGLQLMHRVLLQIEAERLVAELRNDFGKEKDVAARVDRAVAEFRKEHPYK